MTDTSAKEAALYSEVKFYAFRKTKEGTIASFVIHPSEVPDDLAVAEIGQRFLLALVPLADDAEPKQ